MERHLLNDHDIQVNIPKRRTGRPPGPPKRPIFESSRSICQSKTRFSDMNFKVHNAYKRKLAYTNMRAHSKWEASDEKDEVPFEEWKEKHIEEEMEKWESRMQARKRRQTLTIARGYNASVRRFYFYVIHYCFEFYIIFIHNITFLQLFVEA